MSGDKSQKQQEKKFTCWLPKIIKYTIEIKKNADPGKDALKNFGVLNALQTPRGEGAVICLASTAYPLDNMNKVVPIGML